MLHVMVKAFESMNFTFPTHSYNRLLTTGVCVNWLLVQTYGVMRYVPPHMTT